MATQFLAAQRSVFLGIFAILLGAGVCFGQGTTAIRGVVVDEQNAALPGAMVVSRHAASGLERQATTDASGAFELPNVPVGTHDLTISLPGFSTHQQRIDASRSIVPLDVTLPIAAFTD